jgi:hypothetical protein
MASSNTNISTNKLIVNFPSQGRGEAIIFSNSSSNTNSISQKRYAVRFADTAAVNLIDKPSQEELKKAWNSKHEMSSFKDAFLRDGRKMARFLAATPIDGVTSDIEFLIPPELLAKTREGKRVHTATVLSEQARHQRVIGSCDAEKLARVSRESSLPSRRRAHKIAIVYQKM